MTERRRVLASDSCQGQSHDEMPGDHHRITLTFTRSFLAATIILAAKKMTPQLPAKAAGAGVFYVYKELSVAVYFHRLRLVFSGCLSNQ